MHQAQDLAVWLHLVASAGLPLSHLHDPVDESASKDAFVLHCNEECDDFSLLFLMILSIQLVPPCLHRTEKVLIVTLYTFTACSRRSEH